VIIISAFRKAFHAGHRHLIELDSNRVGSASVLRSDAVKDWRNLEAISHAAGQVGGNPTLIPQGRRAELEGAIQLAQSAPGASSYGVHRAAIEAYTGYGRLQPRSEPYLKALDLETAVARETGIAPRTKPG